MARIFRTTKVDKHFHVVLIDSAQQVFLTSVDKNHDHPVTLTMNPTDNSPVVIIGENEGHKHYLEEMAEILPTKFTKEQEDEAPEYAIGLFKNSSNLEMPSRKRGEESSEFFEGKQWDKAVKEELKAQKRSCQTLNYVAAQVDILSGIARQNRLDPRAFPIEGSDEGVSDIASSLLMWISKVNRMSVHEIRVFDDQVITGRGLFHIGMTQKENPLGDIFIERFPWRDGYFGKHDELDASDATHAHKAKWMSLAEAKSRYPELKEKLESMVEVSANYPDNALVLTEDRGSKASTIHEFATDPEILDKGHSRVRFIEHEIKEFRTASIVINDDLSLNQEMTKEEARKAETIPGIRLMELSRERIKIIVTLGTAFIKGYYPDRPYDGFSLTPVYAYKYDDNKGFNGKVHAMKDNQREINKRSSQIIDAANTTLSPGFFHEADTFADDKEKKNFQKNAGKPGQNFQINDISRPPVPKVNPNFPNELFTLQATNIESMQAITNINPSLSGNASPYQSGRAAAGQKQSGLVGNERIFDNFILGKQVVYAKVFKLAQKYFDRERIARIVLSEASDPGRLDDLQVGGQPIPQRRTSEEDQIAMQNIMRLLNTADLAKYDIAIGEQPLSPTMKEAERRMWMEAQQMGMPVPPELLVELSSLPNKAKWSRIMAEKAQQAMEMEKMKFNTELQKAGRVPVNQSQGGS